jgi:hypothetical protein
MTPFLVVLYASNQCGHVFSSQHLAIGEHYPPSVLYLCPACEKTHLFNERRSFHITTSSMDVNFKNYCLAQNISDINVEIL